MHRSRNSAPRGNRRASIAAARLLLALALHGCAPPPVSPAASCGAERFVLASQLDVARLARCSTVAGLVIRTGGPLDLSALRAPVTVAGDLVIGPTVAIEQVALPAVRVIEGRLRVTGNGLLQGLFLSGLERAGRIEIEGNAAVTTIALPRLAAIAGGLSITDNASLEMVDVPALAAIGRELVIERNPKLSLLDAPRLHRVATVRLDAPALPPDDAARLRATPADPAPPR